MAGEDLSFVLGSAIHHGESPEDLLRKLEKDVRPSLAMPSDPIMRLLKEEDAEKREMAVRLLSQVCDDKMVNELLLHLNEERDYTIKGLILKTADRDGQEKDPCGSYENPFRC